MAEQKVGPTVLGRIVLVFFILAAIAGAVPGGLGTS